MAKWMSLALHSLLPTVRIGLAIALAGARRHGQDALLADFAHDGKVPIVRSTGAREVRVFGQDRISSVWESWNSGGSRDNLHQLSFPAICPSPYINPAFS